MVTVGPNCRMTARSTVKSASLTATTSHSSHVDQRLLQQPAKSCQSMGEKLMLIFGGVNAIEMDRPRHVRVTPVCDRTADITSGPFGARRRLMRRNKLKSFSISSSAPAPALALDKCISNGRTFCMLGIKKLCGIGWSGGCESSAAIQFHHMYRTPAAPRMPSRLPPSLLSTAN